MKKRPTVLPRKLVVLLGAYGSFFLVLVCIQLGSVSIQWDAEKHSRPVCEGPAFSLLRFKEEPLARFHTHRLEDVGFQTHVQAVLRPQPHHIEKYVIKHKWQAYDGSRLVSKTDTDVVLMLQASPDRLPFVRQLAQRWQGPISLAVYIPAPAHSPDAAQCNATVRTYLQHRPTVNSDHPFAVSFMYANGLVPNLGCDLNPESTGFEEPDVDLLAFDRRFGKSSGHKATWETVLPAEYPTNALRTVAKEQIESNVFVFPAEADFMPTNNMHSSLRRGSTGTLLSEARQAWDSLEERRAVIVPAFQRLSHETTREKRDKALNDTAAEIEVEFDVPGLQGKSADGQQNSFLGLWGWGKEVACADHDGSSPVTLGSSCWTYEGYSIPLTKRRLHAMIRNGSMSYFHEASFPERHRCYDPQYWLESNQPYEVSVRSPCEPYFIALRYTLPRFDPRFRGRLRDRVSMFAQMAQVGTRFFVSPDHFLTHLPHHPAKPLAALTGDSTIAKYSLVIPYIMTQIMLEEMRSMAQMAYSGATESSQAFRSLLQVAVPKAPISLPTKELQSIRSASGKLLLSAEPAGTSSSSNNQTRENGNTNEQDNTSSPDAGILSTGRVKVKEKSRSSTTPLLRFLYPEPSSPDTSSSTAEPDSQPSNSIEATKSVLDAVEIESAPVKPSPKSSLDFFWTISHKTSRSKAPPSDSNQPSSPGGSTPQDGHNNNNNAPDALDSNLNSNVNPGGPTDSQSAPELNTQSASNQSASESKEATKTGPWETRYTPQAAFTSSPSRSWMQELRGHFRRGGVKVWGADVESALSQDWPELAAVSMIPECTIDWVSTAAAFSAMFSVLAVMTWAIMHLV